MVKKRVFLAILVLLLSSIRAGILFAPINAAPVTPEREVTVKRSKRIERVLAKETALSKKIDSLYKTKDASLKDDLTVYKALLMLEKAKLAREYIRRDLTLTTLKAKFYRECELFYSAFCEQEVALSKSKRTPKKYASEVECKEQEMCEYNLLRTRYTFKAEIAVQDAYRALQDYFGEPSR